MTPTTSKQPRQQGAAERTAEHTAAPRLRRWLVRVAAAVLAGCLAWLAVGHPALRHAEGHLGAAAAGVLAAAAAVLIAGLAAGTAWSVAARWMGLLVAGQAATLQLVAAGNLLGYQHYRPLAALETVPGMAALAIAALQAVLVVAAGGARLGSWLARVRQALAPARLALVAVAFVMTSAALSAAVTVYASELAFASALQLVSLVNVALAVAAMPAAAGTRSLDRVLGAGGAGAEPGGPDRFAVLAACWVLVVCACLAWFSYQAHPHVPDEVVYLYPARYFAAGMLTMPPPPVPAAFELDLMTLEADRWYSPVPPGWPGALAVGVALGAAWLVNPVLNALNVLLAYVALRELYDRRTVRLATLLLCASPWFLFMGMNFMTHTFTLTCALAAAITVGRLRRGGPLVWAVPGGLAIGMLGMIRPLEGLTVAALLGLWGAGRLPWSGTAVLRVGLLAFFAVAAGVLSLPYNTYLTGSPLTFPLMAYTDSVYGAGTNALGFGANRGLGWPGLDPFPGHGPLDVAVNAALNLSALNTELLGWAAGSLLPLVVLVAVGRVQRQDAWLLAVIAAIIGVHSLYWFSGGPDFGARYWYLVIVPCIALTARAATVLGARLDRSSGIAAAARGPGTRSSSHCFTAGMLVLAAAALLCFVPWRAMDKYYHYRNMRPDVRRLAAEHDFGRSLVLVRGRRHPDYASAAIYNPLDLRASAPIYAWDRDPDATRQVLREYADRPVWVVEGPSLTGAGFRVVTGPIPAEQLLLVSDVADQP